MNFKIPLDRVGVIIGPKGSTKRKIEENCDVSIKVDGETGDIEVISTSPSDPSGVLNAQNVVNAIGRGFSPEKAFLLFSDERYLEILDLRDYLGKSPENIRRIKARLIGSKGKAWRLMEELSGVDLAIYGHTVAIIGYLGRIGIAKEAIQMIIQGNQHGTVYSFLLNKKREIKKARIQLWEESPKGEERD
ncbi:MAG TPA: KH domain-containing protein [Candidatus Bathyarchaeia archaeon]|nr:MAG: hypothetical protein A3K70_03445 [Candidatus Bathyarchaeota archaeon RBG_16_48_13]HJX23316.1 KH domain-containing protein [Candidatus Bathyarchaeia archaeon]